MDASPLVSVLVIADGESRGEAFARDLRAARTDFVVCLERGDELLPGAVEQALLRFAAFPKVGAFAWQGGHEGDFDLVDYLFGEREPAWSGSFFRRIALLEAGLGAEGPHGCLEFEAWCGVATRWPVRLVADTLLKSPAAPTRDDLQERVAVVGALFSEDGFFGDDRLKRIGCLYSQHYRFYERARREGRTDEMKRIRASMSLLAADAAARTNEYRALFSDPLATRESDPAVLLRERTQAHERAARLWANWSTRAPRFVRQALSQELRTRIRKMMVANLGALSARMHPSARSSRGGASGADDLAAPVFSPRLYHDTAMLFYGRGDIDYAEFLWRKAEPLNDIDVDSVAVQAALFSPSETNESLLARQKHWAARHARALPGMPPLEAAPWRRGARPIRVGYFCSFLDSDVFRAMFAGVARAHDRSRVLAFAYSVTPVARHLQQAFDEVRVVGTIPDREFVSRVRADAIDIFVEMSGFSPMHRYAAMASRCAPVQIAYFNHSGTCGVPNVDYVFADAISIPPQDEPFYTEEVWRLPGDFLLFSYEWARLPEPSEPPSRRNGFVTFGCFGSAGKLSDELIQLWSRVLHAVPGARFYIRNSPLGRGANRAFLRQRFARHGIAADRLRLGGATDWDKFIGSYADVDISMDTYPYCGANTVGESLWQGVPVITLKGNRFSSRYGASHVAAAGCPELIAQTPEQYVTIARELAASPERLLHYRRNLRSMAMEHGLSDPARFARKLEAAYEQMMDRRA